MTKTASADTEQEERVLMDDDDLWFWAEQLQELQHTMQAPGVTCNSCYCCSFSVIAGDEESLHMLSRGRRAGQ